MKHPSKSTTSAKFGAAGLAFTLLLAACGGSEEGLHDEKSELEEVQETANEALAKAEAAELAISGLEAELAFMEEEAGHGEDADDEEAGHGEETDSEEADHGEEAEEEHAGPAHWGYEGEEGPASWSELDENYAACEAGISQSPIDVTSSDAFVVGLNDLELDWSDSEISVIDNGHTIQANVAAGNTTDFDGTSYDLLQFHFHRPSEHTVNTEAFPMELHFVHADADGNLAVVGVLLAEGEENAAFDGIWAAQTAEGDDAVIAGFDLTSLLPENMERYRYSGSLTTPPCSEGVNWNVLTNPVELSEDQVEAFLYEGNARPVMPLNGRSVLSDEG